MTVLLRPEAPSPTRLGGLALVTGVAVREALESLGARGIDLYWPNDLYFQHRKLGGILGEVKPESTSSGSAGAAGAAERYLVALGIGLNIDLAGLDPPAELRDTLSSLVEAGCRERKPEAIAPAILDRLEIHYAAFQAGSPIPAMVGDHWSAWVAVWSSVTRTTSAQPTV